MREKESRRDRIACPKGIDNYNLKNKYNEGRPDIESREKKGPKQNRKKKNPLCYFCNASINIYVSIDMDCTI